MESVEECVEVGKQRSSFLEEDSSSIDLSHLADFTFSCFILVGLYTIPAVIAVVTRIKQHNEKMDVNYHAFVDFVIAAASCLCSTHMDCFLFLSFTIRFCFVWCNSKDFVLLVVRIVI